MTPNEINEYAKTITYTYQITIVIKNDGEKHFGYFSANTHSKAKNQWGFFDFSLNKIISIDGDDILSIEIKERSNLDI